VADSYGNQRQLGDRRLIDISASTRWRLGLGGRDLAHVRSCQKKKKDYEIVTALAASFARLQSLHLVLLKV